MNLHRVWFRWIVLLGFTLVTGMLSGCSSDSASNTESLNIYEVWATNASFTPLAGDETATRFQLNLSNQFTEDDDVLYFTNRGAQQAGTVTLRNLINAIWPRVYGSVAPNAILQGKTAANETVYISCIIDKPVLNKATGQLSFSITYLDGRRPEASLALTDLELIITNNSATVQPAVWSHNLDGDSATLEPAKNADGTFIDGAYTFRMQKAFGSLLGITCAPQRKTETVSTKSYFDGWNARFGANPPNVSVSFTDSNLLVSQVFTATLSNPVYDENTGSVSFTAKNVYFPFGSVGKTTLTVKAPTVFIDAGPGNSFPTDDNNVFSIQYRNSTSDAITVWLTGDQPPCSKANASKCDTSGSPDGYTARWNALADVFKDSGTQFYIISANGVQRPTSVSNRVDLDKGEVLRIVPPIVGGVPEWWFYRGGIAQTAGTNSWVTKKGVTLPSPPANGLVFEHNVQGEFFTADANKQLTVKQPDLVNFDISGVNGIHAKATMYFEGLGCGEKQDCSCSSKPSRVVKIPLDAYNGSNDGCPYIMTINGLTTCPNPKMYPHDKLDDNQTKAPWVKAASAFTLDSVPQNYQDAATQDLTQYLNDYFPPVGNPPPTRPYDSLSGFVLADAAAGVNKANPPKAYAGLKSAYHIWWQTNPVATGWLGYLQKNKYGPGDTYGWAYDEMKWHSGDTFNTDGNPVKPDNTIDDNLIYPDISCPSKPEPGTKQGKYLNFDILYVM